MLQITLMCSSMLLIIQKAWAAFNGLVQRVFAQTAIREGIRISLFRSLILSVLLYGAETWTLTDIQLHRLNVVLMRWLRRRMWLLLR